MPTDEGKLYLATVEDLASERIVGFGLSEHHDAELATSALKMAVTVRGGDVTGAIFHSDRGSEIHRHSVRAGLRDAADLPVDGPGRIVFRQCRRGELVLDAGVGAVPQATLRHEAGRSSGGRPLHRLYNRVRRHSSCEMKPPIAFEAILAARAAETVPAEEAA